MNPWLCPICSRAMRPTAGVPTGSLGRPTFPDRCIVFIFITGKPRGRTYACLDISHLPARLGATALAAATIEAAARRLRTRLVDLEAAATELIVVQLADRFLRLVVRAHLDESES